MTTILSGIRHKRYIMEDKKRPIADPPEGQPPFKLPKQNETEGNSNTDLITQAFISALNDPRTQTNLESIVHNQLNRSLRDADVRNVLLQDLQPTPFTANDMIPLLNTPTVAQTLSDIVQPAVSSSVMPLANSINEFTETIAQLTVVNNGIIESLGEVRTGVNTMAESINNLQNEVQTACGNVDNLCTDVATIQDGVSSMRNTITHFRSDFEKDTQALLQLFNETRCDCERDRHQ